MATAEELCDNSGCIAGVEAVGLPTAERLSQLQTYRFDPSRECKLTADGKISMMFTYNLEGKFTLAALDTSQG
jgi:hypothetical protein